MKKRLLLLPNSLGEGNVESHFPHSLRERIAELDGLFCESEKSARSYLKQFILKGGRSFRDLPLRLYTEHTKEAELKELIQEIKEGESWGLISDAGLPCIADPGSSLVRLAREGGVEIIPLSGANALILALMLSGLGAQRFLFYGYPPIKPEERKNKLRELGLLAKKERMTIGFMEAPYRNQSLFEACIAELDPHVRLCLALDLTMPTQEVLVEPVGVWKKSSTPNLKNRPAIFLFSHNA